LEQQNNDEENEGAGAGDDSEDDDEPGIGGASDLPVAMRIERSVAKQFQHATHLRLLVCGRDGKECGQSVVGAALLSILAAWPIHSVSLAAIVSQGAGDPTPGAPKALAEPLRHARQGAAVLHLPVMDAWAMHAPVEEMQDAGHETATWEATPAWRAASISLMNHGAARDMPWVVVATCRQQWDVVPHEVAAFFDCHVQVDYPGEEQVAEVLRRVALVAETHQIVALAKDAGREGLMALLT